MPFVRLSLAALLAALTMAPAHAQVRAPQETETAAEPDLYVEAMQAIAEGRKDRAILALKRMIAKGPREAHELLDLAVVQCAVGHAEEAELLFKSVEAGFNPPQGIRDIIAQQRLQGCKRWQAASQISFAAGRGYDRNVNQGASNPSYTLGGTGGATLDLLPEFLPQQDNYSMVSGDYLHELTEAGAIAFGQVQLRRNDHLSNYNTASLFGGFEQPWQLGRWRARGTILGGMLTLGGRLYQQQGQLQLRVTPPLPLPAGVELYGLAGVAHVNYKTLTNFDANTEELRAVLSYRNRLAMAELSAGYQNDHAAGQRPGGDRSGWSFALSARHRISSQFQTELDLSRQTWQGQAAYSAPLIDAKRHQDIRAARASLVYLLDARHSIHLEARHVQNKENISIFQYNNTVVQLSWHSNRF